MALEDFQPDCARCTALCCVGFAFDASEEFDYNKFAGDPCVHLAEDGACTIHDRLEQSGFAGCVKYSCYGAGQIVVQDMFEGRHWRDHPGEAQAMYDALGVLRRVREQLMLLELAADLPLDDAQSRERSRLIADLDPAEEWTPVALRDFDIDGAVAAVSDYLASLRDSVAR